MKRYLILMFCLFLIGCAYTPSTRLSYEPLTIKQYLPKNDHATIPISTREIYALYKEIGIISTTGKEDIGYDELKDRIKKKAREIGADAVVNIEYGRKEKNELMVSNFWDGYSRLFSKTEQPYCRGVAVIFTAK